MNFAQMLTNGPKLKKSALPQPKEDILSALPATMDELLVRTKWSQTTITRHLREMKQCGAIRADYVGGSKGGKRYIYSKNT